MGYGEEFLHRKGVQALLQTAQGSSGVAIPRGIYYIETTLGDRFSGKLGRVRLMIRPYDPKDLCQHTRFLNLVKRKKKNLVKGIKDTKKVLMVSKDQIPNILCIMAGT